MEHVDSPSLQLTQGKLFETREAKVQEFVVRFSKAALSIERERSIPIEDLVLDHVSRGSRVEGMSLFLTMMFLIGLVNSTNGVLTLALLLGCLGMGVYCWTRSGSYVLIPVAGQDAFELFGNRPTRAAVDDFIRDLGTKARSYAREKYGHVSELRPVDEQMRRITWLRDRNFISDDEYRGLVGSLEELLRKRPESPIGFKRDP